MAIITTEACVIGAGVMGAAATFALTERGVRTVLIERNGEPGRETTARSGAIIRAHYGIPELVSLSKEANDYYRRFKEYVGNDCGFVPSGYCVLVDESDTDTLRANIAMHQGLGVNVSLISPGEVGDLVPNLKTDDVALAAYEPDGGYADPAKTVRAFVTRAHANGAVFGFGVSVVAAMPEKVGWRLTLSNGDEVSTEHVVICTGNWSSNVGKLFGLSLPVTPMRAQIVVMERPEAMLESFPVVSDLINLAYFRTDGEKGLWVGSSDSSELQDFLKVAEGFDESVSAKTVATARQKTTMRFAGMPEDSSRVQRGFSGLYETTPDWQPIVDSYGGSLHVAVGFSGHGFKLAPVVGIAMADYVTIGTPRREFGIFCSRRFADGRPIKSRFSYERAKFLR